MSFISMSLLRSRVAVVAAACVTAAGVVAAGQSVDDLIAKNLAAKGGVEKWRAIQSIKQVAKMNMQGMEATMTIYTKRPNRLRQELVIGGQTVISGFDGVTPWMVNPLAGITRPISLTGPQADQIRDQSDFDGPLVDYKAKGYTLELLGLETLGERKVHHLRMISVSRQTVHLYLDAATGLEVKRSTQVDSSKFDAELADYRTIDGLTVPFQIRQLTNGVPLGEMKLQTVEFNVTMDDAIFRIPKG